MKWNCDLIQDLLPLYAEDLCSAASRQAVEAHLRECESCRRLTAPLPIEEPADTPAADRAVKKSMKKVKCRWLASLLAAVLAVPLLLLGINQYRGEGLCYTNLDEIYTARRFLHALEKENWEKAAKYHDFSDDYESILDALSQEPTDWRKTFTPFDLAGFDYAASTHLSRDGLLPETTADLYSFLFNQQGRAMIPLALWEQLMVSEPAAFSQDGWTYWLNGEKFGKISTPWGEYVVTDGSGYDTAWEYAAHFDLIPAAIYDEAKPALEEEARQLHATTRDHIGWVSGLTESEFAQEMVRRYTADLQALEGTVTFECNGFRSAHRMTDSWYVIFSVTVTQGTKTLEAEIDFDVSGGKITVVGLSYRPGADWIQSINQALYPSAHPEY